MMIIGLLIASKSLKVNQKCMYDCDTNFDSSFIVLLYKGSDVVNPFIHALYSSIVFIVGIKILCNPQLR